MRAMWCEFRAVGEVWRMGKRFVGSTSSGLSGEVLAPRPRTFYDAMIGWVWDVLLRAVRGLRRVLYCALM